ncbi:MAG: BON domain-containing protein [Leptospirales bacterium]
MKKTGMYRSALVLAIVLMSAGGCASTPKHEATGAYFDDSVITSKVKAAILNDSSLKVNEISIKTTRGVVRLRGYVHTQAEVDEAIKVSMGVAGVKSVKNELNVN